MTRTLSAVTGQDHEMVPQRGTAYSVRTSLPARLTRQGDYPVEAFCACGRLIRCEYYMPIGAGGEWRHLDRVPGEGASAPVDAADSAAARS